MDYDIIEFEKSFAIQHKEAMKQVNKVVKKSIEDTFYAIVEDTPVGDQATGEARKGPNYEPGNLKGNWQISFNSPKTGELDRKDPSGGQVVGEIKAQMQMYSLYDEVYFTNNADYAYKIEYLGGSPTKAPKGMMKINVKNFKNVLMSNVKNKWKNNV